LHKNSFPVPVTTGSGQRHEFTVRNAVLTMTNVTASLVDKRCDAGSEG
jgi:hypothetical protein